MRGLVRPWPHLSVRRATGHGPRTTGHGLRATGQLSINFLIDSLRKTISDFQLSFCKHFFFSSTIFFLQSKSFEKKKLESKDGRKRAKRRRKSHFKCNSGRPTVDPSPNRQTDKSSNQQMDRSTYRWIDGLSG